LRGILREVEDDLLVVVPTKPDQAEGDEAAPEEIRIPVGKVQEGNLDPDFDVQALINADRRQRKEEKRIRRQEKSKGKKGARKSRPRGPKGRKGETPAGEE
jgi:hypothetical protein